MAIIPARMVKIKFLAPLARLSVLGRVFAPPKLPSPIPPPPTFATLPTVELGLRRFAPSFRGDALSGAGTAALHALRLGAQTLTSGISQWFDAHPMVTRIVSLPALMMMGALPADMGEFLGSVSSVLPRSIRPPQELPTVSAGEGNVPFGTPAQRAILVMTLLARHRTGERNRLGFYSVDSDESVALGAVDALGNMGPEGVPSLMTIAGDTYSVESARIRAIVWLGELQTAQAANLLTILVEDCYTRTNISYFNETGRSFLDSWPVGNAAMQALFKLGPHAEAGLTKILGVKLSWEDHDGLRIMQGHAARGLATIWAASSKVTPAFVKQLVQMATYSSSGDAALQAVEGLGILGDAGKDALQQVLQSVYVNGDVRARAAILLATPQMIPSLTFFAKAGVDTALSALIQMFPDSRDALLEIMRDGTTASSRRVREFFERQLQGTGSPGPAEPIAPASTTTGNKTVGAAPLTTPVRVNPPSRYADLEID